MKVGVAVAGAQALTQNALPHHSRSPEENHLHDSSILIHRLRKLHRFKLTVGNYFSLSLCNLRNLRISVNLKRNSLKINHLSAKVT